MAKNQRILRPKPNVRAMGVVIYLAGVAALALRVPERFRLLVVAGYAGLGALWLADLWLKRIVLGEDDLVIFANFRSRTLSRVEIESVTWEKGGGAALKLRDSDGSRWVPLPNVGLTPQSIAQTIRAWLRTTKDADDRRRDPAT